MVVALAIAVLVLAAAVLARAEVALLRTPRVRVDLAAQHGDRRAAALLELLDDLPLVLNTILMAVLAVQVGAAALTGYLADRLVGGVVTPLATLALTVVLFVYSEAIPKTLAVRAPVASALGLATPLRWLVRGTHRLTRLLLTLADLQTPGHGASANPAFTEEELRVLAEESATAGHIRDEDVELVHRSFEFGDRRVGEVLVPRSSIVGIDAASSASAALGTAIRAGHRRLPVHLGDLDAIIGSVRLRDVAAAVEAGTDVPVGTLVRPVLRVGPSTPISDVLARMQSSAMRMAIVVDDRDATVGLVTIEDVVAELVGEIEEQE